MSVVANFTIPATEFALGKVLEVGNEVRIRLESMIPTGEGVLPFFWVPAEHVDAVREVLVADSLTEHVTVVDDRETEALFHVEWSSEVNGLVDALSESRGVVLDGVGHGDDWEFQVRFPNYDQLSTFYQQCVQSKLSLDVTSVHDVEEVEDGGGYGLTTGQRVAIVTAYQEGYFSVPRGITLEELSEEMGISDSATSQRIRRGLSVLIAATLLADPSTEYDP